MNENLNLDEKKKLEAWVNQIEEKETAQAKDLIENCDISFQFAKTHSVYVKDWEKTKKKMENRLKAGELPEDVSPRLFRAMIDESEKIIEKKLKIVRGGFREKFGESIYNYLDDDGTTKQVFGSSTDKDKKRSNSTKSTTKQSYNNTAVIGFALSILSVFGLDLAGIIGLIVGIIALKQINRRGEKGRGLAIAAIVVGLLFGLVADLLQNLNGAGGY